MTQQEQINALVAQVQALTAQLTQAKAKPQPLTGFGISAKGNVMYSFKREYKRWPVTLTNEQWMDLVTDIKAGKFDQAMATYKGMKLA